MSRIVSRLASLSALATSQAAYRHGVLDLLREVVAYDGALFHALSPRVPLTTAAVVGLDRAVLERSMPRWDGFAVELGRLRDLANASLVARDVDAFPPGSRDRTRWVDGVLAPLGARSLTIMHLIVRGHVHGAVVLTAKSLRAFDAVDVSALRELSPLIAVGDLLHARLDAAPEASAAVVLRCTDGRLTPRQREIVEHVARGHTNHAIATALALSPNTLRNHLANIFARLGAANRAEVVRLAVVSGPPIAVRRSARSRHAPQGNAASGRS